MRKIIDIITQYQPQLLNDTPIEAAVMILLLITDKGGIEIPLTKRADTLPDYAGHFSLPGGMRDDYEINLYQTAQRELHEELNITREQYQYVGQLDDMLTRDNHLVRPYVITMQKIDFENHYQISADEIASIYFLPLERLKEFKDEPYFQMITNRRPSYVFIDDNIVVWGLTAGILMRLHKIIEHT